MAKRSLEIADSTGNDVIVTANSSGLELDAGLKLNNSTSETAQITTDSSGIILDGGIKISNAQGITANSSGLVFANPLDALPGAVDNGVFIGLVSNSTGVALVINTTGTTHKFLNVTADQPT